MTKQEREILNSMDYVQLVKDAKQHYGLPGLSVNQIYKYYMTLPEHVNISYNSFYGYYKQHMDIEHYYPESKEPYTGNNKTILYYLELLSTKR